MPTLGALRYKSRTCNLLLRNVELFHYFLTAQIFKVLNDRRSVQGGLANESAADFTGDPLHGSQAADGTALPSAALQATLC